MDYFAGLSLFCEILGFIILFYYLIRALLFIFREISLVLSRRSLPKRLKQCGQWAVVTGATDGIGKEYAFQLAAAGMKIFLISRNPERLSNTAKEIESKYHVETQVLAVDFSLGESIYDRIKPALDGLDIGVLVNNVATNTPYPEYFVSVPEDMCKGILYCNILSIIMMTRIVLPGMCARRRGSVVNISSGAGFMPLPLGAEYSASKAFIDNFSAALHTEVADMGIQILVIAPFVVTTKMSKFRRSSFLIPAPYHFVRGAITLIATKYTYDTGYFWHNVQFVGALVLKTLAPNLILRVLLRITRNMRKRAIAKLDKKPQGGQSAHLDSSNKDK